MRGDVFTAGAAGPSAALCHSNLRVVWVFLTWVTFVSPVPGQGNWPPAGQPDLRCPVENHVILFSAVWWVKCLLGEKGRPGLWHWSPFMWLQGDFSLLRRLGWLKRKPDGGRVWWVISWICSADRIYFGLDRTRTWTVCCKEPCCWDDKA